MPGETERRSVFRLPVHFPVPEWNGHQNLAVRWPRVLAGDEAIVKGTFPVVADGRRTSADLAGTSGAVAVGGGQSGHGSRAGVAKSKLNLTLNKRLAFCFHFWHAAVMPEAETWRYRGQTIDREQIAFLREFIREHPHSSRWKLSRQLCEALGWKQANGALRDVVCRGLLLMLERAGEIELPPVRWRICRSAPDGASTAGSRPDRHHAADDAAGSVGGDRDSTRAAHSRRTAVP